LYGKGTAGALITYNKQNLNGADLKKSKNVEKLFNVVLGLNPAPKSNSDGKSYSHKETRKYQDLSNLYSFCTDHSHSVVTQFLFYLISIT
jgi:hypothetical protein